MRILSHLFRGRSRWYLFVLFGALIVYLLVWAPFLSQRIAPEKVWTVVQKVAPAYGLNPAFVYAIIMAESSLNPWAATGTSSARGLMQVSRGAWKTVTDEPFDEAWVWQKNIEIGTRYLAFCKRFLERHRVFSYARLAACYHLGPEALEACHWKMSCLPTPEDVIYRKLYSGHVHPVQVP